MVDAMKAVEDGMSVAKAARKHKVPTTTLKDRVSGNVVHGAKIGPEPYLSHDEETKLANYITECASAGYKNTRAEIMTIAENTMHDKKKLRKDGITYGWYSKFMKRHQLSLHKRKRNKICAASGNPKLYPNDELRPTINIEVEEDSKEGTSYYKICI